MHGAVARRLAGAAASLVLAVLAPAATAAWTPAQDIGPPREAGAPVGAAPTVAIDGHGNATAVWTVCGTDTGCQVLAADHPAGGAWAAPRPLGEPGPQVAPTLAVNAAGDAVAAWGGDGVRTAARPAGGQWGPAQTIALPPPDACCRPGGASTPAAAVDPAGDAVLVWRAGYSNIRSCFPRGPVGGYSLLLSSRRQAGGDWEPARRLAAQGSDPLTCQARSLGFDAAMDPSGAALALWDESGILRAASRPADGDWGGAETIAAFGSPEDVAFDAGGAAIAVWRAGASLNVSRRPAGGAWEPPEAAGDFSPETGLDARGTLVMVFGSPYVVGLSKPVGGDVTPFVEIRPVGGARQSEQTALAVAPDGRAVAVWREFEGAFDASNTIPRYRYGVTAAIRSPNGTWGPQQYVVGPGPPMEVIAEQPAVAVDAVGHAAAAWLGGNGQVQAALLDPTPPTLASVVVPAQGVAGAPVTLDAAAADDFAGLAGPPAWSFGDGATASGASVTHAWSAPGDYTVSVQATDAAGNVARAERRIAVAARPAPPPPSLPSASTGRGRAVCATRAVLSGSVDGRGLPATARFAYGVRTLGRRTPARAGGPAARAVGAAVSGLRPGTAYRFRIIATSDAGSALGAVRVFRTPPARLGPWRARPRSAPRGYRLVTAATAGGARYLALARPCQRSLRRNAAIPIRPRPTR